MAISTERLERYKDFVDPENTGASYDPRQGLERLMGILSPDPKGIVLAVMEEDWYGTGDQLGSRIFEWLDMLGLPSSIWPISNNAIWSYCERRNNKDEIIDGSLVDLGAVVKKAKDPFQTLYRRSIVGTELAVPLVQQAVRFVLKAREYAETRKMEEKPPPKFDSIWRIIGGSNSTSNQRRPVAVWDVINFLANNPGKYRKEDVADGTDLSVSRLGKILPSLGESGIIDYISPQTETEGIRGKEWAIFRLVDKHLLALDPDQIYQQIKARKQYFHYRNYLTKVLEYIKANLDSEYESRTLGEKLKISSFEISRILSELEALDLLGRPDPGFKGRYIQSAASANGLTFLFNDLVCAPAQGIASSLSPLPLGAWNRQELVIYLQNYNQERSQVGPQGGEAARELVLEIMPEREEIKLSYVTDLFNNRSERELKASSIRGQLKILMKLDKIEQTRPGYYRRLV